VPKEIKETESVGAMNAVGGGGAVDGIGVGPLGEPGVYHKRRRKLRTIPLLSTRNPLKMLRRRLLP
jgi:hypothetical protein